MTLANLYTIFLLTLFSNTRKHKSGCGVGIFIKSDLNVKHRTDLQSYENNIYESIFDEIIQPNEKKHNCWLYL